MNILFDAVGWLGMAMVIIAFGLNSMKRLESDSLLYILLNGLGSAFLIVNCYHNGAMPPMVLNIIWLVIALISLWNYYKSQN